MSSEEERPTERGNEWKSENEPNGEFKAHLLYVLQNNFRELREKLKYNWVADNNIEAPHGKFAEWKVQ